MIRSPLKKATKADLEAMYRGICLRLDAIGHALSGTTYDERVARSTQCTGNLEPIDFHKPKKK